MPFFTTTRAAVLLLLFETIGAVCAQSSGSPYSAYGFGDFYRHLLFFGCH